MESLIAIVVYVLICAVFVVSVRRDRGLRLVYGRKLEDPMAERKAVSIYIWPLIVSLLFALYNRYIIGIQDRLTGDRMNYYTDFTYGRVTGFAFFDAFLKFVKLFTRDYRMLLAFVTFLSCFILYIALRSSRHCTIESAMFISASYFVFSSFVNLKQSPVCALAAVMFVVLVEYKGFRYDLLSIAIIVVSCNFHITGFMLIPLYFLLRLKFKNRTRSTILMILLTLAFAFIQPMLVFVGNNLGSVFPMLGQRIAAYASDELVVDTGDKAGLVVLKGFPYYMLVIMGFIDRKLHKGDEEYDKYLILSLISALSALLSIYTYWYIRMPVLFVIPMGILFSKIMSKRKGKDKVILLLVIVGSLAFFTIRSVILNYQNYGGY
ncbi:MAG: EpsG family protein [Saccharofermentans sp.]|nr:EpsG family protein [Saccharofermentans sp.]